jgi:hypothetical protein
MDDLLARFNRRFNLYAVRPRKDHRGVDLISDALPFGRLWYGEPDASGVASGIIAVHYEVYPV